MSTLFRQDYNKINGFKSCFSWLQNICAKQNIHITGNAIQIKGDKDFLIPTDIGNLYLKIVDDAYINELTFTHRLIERKIPNLAEWIGCAPELNAFLSCDMGGCDFSSQPNMDIEDLLSLFKALAHTQKESISYVKSSEFYGYDYSIDATINELKRFPEDVCEMLSGTQYKITSSEKKKLIQNTESVVEILNSIHNIPIPNTIHNSDMASYNA